MLSILSMPTSNCPFRLVDEINQGMDKYNEHSVMKAVKEIIDDSPEDEVCQFFIITPKVKRTACLLIREISIQDLRIQYSTMIYSTKVFQII